MIKRLARIKKFCPLEKGMPMEQIADFIFRCPSCGYEVNESIGDSSYHHTVLVSRPPVFSISGAKKYVIKEEKSRSDDFKQLNKEFELSKRADPQSMYNPHVALKDGKTTKGQWMSADYANMSLDYTPEDLEKLFNRFKK